MSYRPMPSFAICLPVDLVPSHLWGYAGFSPGVAACHVHEFDESITIVEGQAVCLVQGNRYMVGGYDTAFVRRTAPSISESFERSHGHGLGLRRSEPGRTLVESGYCDGTLAWHSRRPMREKTHNEPYSSMAALSAHSSCPKDATNQPV